MRYLFFTNTPAHVHLYKHAAAQLQSAGHTVRVLARDYGCTVPLLEETGLPFELYGKCDTTKFSLVRELPRHYLRMVRATRWFDPDVIFGIGFYAAHAGLLSRTPTLLIHDSEPSSLDHALSKPFARAIFTPHTFGKRIGDDHYRFRGFKECAYLHPDVFSTSDEIRERLGVTPEERFAILRFNAFGSHHDVNHTGFTPAQRRRLLDRLADHLTVFVSDESGEMSLEGLDARPFDLHPAALHDALAEASLLVADTQTIVTEAALLGTPAVRSNSFVGDGDMGNFVELEREGLVYNVDEFDEVLAQVDRLLTDETVVETWQTRREEYLEGLVNLTDLIVALAGRVDAVGQIPELEPA